MPGFTRKCLLLLARWLLAGLALAIIPVWADTGTGEDFQSWLADLRQDALSRGISEATLEIALKDLQPVERVVELDRRQPEFVDTFLNYLDRRVNDKRIRAGRERLAAHRALLRDIQSEYGIPPQYLVAFWGLETNYGATMGHHPVLAALATLAFEGRRGEFFRNELLEALAILDTGHISAEAMLGSWAGAMGQMQFMPSTFRAYAVDADGDGRKDLWNDLPDALASAANYLASLGWKNGEMWGREVRLPAGFDWSEARLDNRKAVKDWAALGVRRADGRPLPRSDLEGAILLPQGYDGPAFLVYDNFLRIFTWNRSVNYALAVGLLADRLLGGPDLRARRGMDNRRLSRDQALEIQLVLSREGLYDGALDGMLGSRTRAAIQAYQQRNDLPADGHPSPRLLEHMQSQGRVIKTGAAAQPAEGAEPARHM